MNSRLTKYIFLATILALLFAYFFPDLASHTEIGGQIFLDLLKVIIVPLVMVSILYSIIQIGTMSQLSKAGSATVIYYLTTTFMAVTLGLLVSNIVEPGLHTNFMESTTITKSPSLEKMANEPQTIVGFFLSLLSMFFSGNLFKSMAEMDLLPLIFFSLLLGIVITSLPNEKTKTIKKLIEELNDIFMGFIFLVIKVSPLGIFCLVSSKFGQAKLGGQFSEIIQGLSYYVTAVVVGLVIHGFIVLPILFALLRRQNPFLYMKNMGQALLTAFSTASSAATLPITRKCIEVNAGISKKAGDFVLPFGATINMDGTALYEVVAVLFIAQVLGMDLTITQQIFVAIAGALAAIGAASIPEAGLVTMVIVLHAVGLPAEHIGIILGVDWFLDRCRTAINVWGDAVGVGILEKYFK